MIPLYLFTLLLCVVFPFGSCTPFNECMNVSKPIDMRITNCTELPCSFFRGRDMEIDIDFEARNEIHQLKAKVLAFALGVETNYPLPKSDVCQGLINGECPLDPGEVVTYKMGLPILSSFPQVHVVLNFYLESEHGVEYCMRFNGDVVDS